MSPEAARAAIDASRADPQDPANQPGHPRHTEAAAYRERMPADAAERALHQRWGSAFDPKMAAAHSALDLDPTFRAELEAQDLDFQPDMAEWLAKVGESVFDATTPHGFRRLKARSLAALESEAKQAGRRA